MVLDDQLSNTLADAAQCTPDDISDIFTHKAVSDSLSSAGCVDTRDARCGRSWGCVRFIRADHCDAAFRKLHERADKGEDVVRVIFAPPDFMAWHSAACKAPVQATTGFGITGPGFAPGCNQEAIQQRFKLPLKPHKSEAGRSTPAANGLPNEQSIDSVEIQEVDKVASSVCIDLQCGSTSMPTSTNRKSSLGNSAQKRSQAPPGRSKLSKGRQPARIGNVGKSCRHGKRSQRGGNLPRPRLPKPPQHHAMPYGPLDTLGNLADAPTLPSGFHPVQSQFFPPSAPHVRSIIAADQGVHALIQVMVQAHYFHVCTVFTMTRGGQLVHASKRHESHLV